MNGQGTTLNLTPARAQSMAHSSMPSTLPPIVLKKFAEKMATKEVFTVSASTAPIKVYNFPQETLLAQALYAQSAMRYFRHDLVVRVTPLGTGWIGGNYYLTFLPYNNADSTALTNLNDIVKLTSCPYVMIDLASNQPVELVIPYRYHKEFFTVGDTTDYFGSVVLSPGLMTLQTPSVGTMTVDLEVQFGVRNLESYIPSEIGNAVLRLGPQEETIPEGHMADDAKEDVVSAELTSDEKQVAIAVSPIGHQMYQSDIRCVSHLSDMLKRPSVRYNLNPSTSTGLVYQFIPELQAYGAGSPYGAWAHLLACYKAWKGDIIICIEQLNPGQGDEFAINLSMQDITNAPFTAGDANNLYQYKICESSGPNTIPGDTTPAYGNNHWSDVSPLLLSDATRFRTNIPFHSQNKFTVYDPLNLTGLPVVDTTPPSVVGIFRSNHSSSPPSQVLRFIIQTADSYRLSHYNPAPFCLVGILTTTPSVVNFAGQYFDIS